MNEKSILSHTNDSFQSNLFPFKGEQNVLNNLINEGAKVIESK